MISVALASGASEGNQKLLFDAECIGSCDAEAAACPGRFAVAVEPVADAPAMPAVLAPTAEELNGLTCFVVMRPSEIEQKKGAISHNTASRKTRKPF